MMFSDEEIKEIPESSFMRPGDEIISITEVCLSDKYYKKDLGFNVEPSLLPTSCKNDLDSRFRDNFFSEGLEMQQARFAWTEEDGNIVALVSEPGFGTTGQTTFGKDLDAALDSEIKEADTSSSVLKPSGRLETLAKQSLDKQHQVSSTSDSSVTATGYVKSQGTCKIDKSDPRSRFHYVKYVKRHGRTVKLWECGICSREFQHQYTLMRHLPTHTDERNFHCDACGKSFRQLSTLSQHRAIHSAERPYACEMCNKTFNRVSTLISHRKTHNFEKPYKCHICPKGFHQKGNLRNHLFTHTNERPYRCNICFKGFNQQSNLVCHKNKAHPEVACPTSGSTNGSTPVTHSSPKSQPDTKPQIEHCEVSSTVGPYLPAVEGPSSSKWTPKPADIWIEKDTDWSMNSGVIVDPINTYHMGVAVATKQTPFALLKPDNGAAVLVKVIDTNLPGGKQMLVPATAEDFRVGGKIVIKDEPGLSTSTPELDDSCDLGVGVGVGESVGVGGAVQIRVPVVATVVPRVAGGRLHLAVQEPHQPHHHHVHVGGVNMIEPCRSRGNPHPANSKTLQPKRNALQRADLQHHDYEEGLHTGPRTPSSSMLSPSPSPAPLDFISMDLFEPMECIPIPLGPQITPVDVNQAPASDDSDIFIGEFEESIPLSDSD